MADTKSWVVVKFGGTSVSTLTAWKNIVGIINQHRQSQQHVLLVCSAPYCVSDLLSQMFDVAVEGGEYQLILEEIHGIYFNLSVDLGVDMMNCLQKDWNNLQQCILGISLVGIHSPKCKAKVLSFGEVLLTKLASSYLQNQSLLNHWFFSGDYLKAEHDALKMTASSYLSAHCGYDHDSIFVDHLHQLDECVVITQGFIASNELNEIVLLGRGGSDVSAAYFAAKIDASCCEIWTDVPGIYSANPYLIPQARHLLQLTYEEAQEISLMGAKVLHPRAIVPVMKKLIPLFIRQTTEPTREGTEIITSLDSAPAIKAVSVRHDVVVLSLEALTMWQQSGFLAEVFSCFKHHDLSIDLISTSQSNITLSLDVPYSDLNRDVFQRLQEDLNRLSKVTVITPCAAISAVGCHIRKVLYQISSLFSVFRKTPVYLLTQAANDLSFTVVVDNADAESILREIHETVIENSISQACFGLSYEHEFADTPHLETEWWVSKKDVLLTYANKETPLYLYDESTLIKKSERLLSCQSIDRLFYSIKSNANKQVLRVFYEKGLGFECVSIFEVHHVLQVFPEIDRQRILFTPNFSSRKEYADALTLGVFVTVDNLHPLTEWPDLFEHHSIILRIDPGFGVGHHHFVETGGDESKFGIPVDQVSSLLPLLEKHHIQVIGLHAHSGSGILNATNWIELADKLMSVSQYFPDLSIVNVGGGLGISEKAGQQPLDIERMDQALLQFKNRYPHLQLWMEPGRYLAAESGVLLARVNQVKLKSSLTYIGIDAGMNTLIRPALYGAYHRIVNLTRLQDSAHHLSHIVGPICESGDFMGRSRWLPKTQEGDILLIANVGAYGFTMSSRYNMRPYAQEVLLLECDFI